MVDSVESKRGILATVCKLSHMTHLQNLEVLQKKIDPDSMRK